MSKLDQFLLALDALLFVIMIAHFVRIRDLSNKLRKVEKEAKLKQLA